ncbi:MAG: AAA family ATPase [Clostridia bacterium]|nr:AAA family ATPase [Clostridia bacterium]
MGISIFDIKPHKVSRDLSGYITYIYGKGKTGKTTLASQMDKSLLLAWEKGYNAIPGIMAIDVKSWSEMKMILRDLKKPEAQEMYKCIVVDTVDIAAAACEKYICSQNGVDTLGDLAWGKGWTLVKKELEETFRSITQMGYALFFISHEKEKVFKRENGTEYNQHVPSVSPSYNEIIKDMADIYAYAHQVRNEETGEVNVRLTLRSMDGSADTGCRFKYIDPEIDFTYPALVKALNDAIEKEAKLTNNQFITNEREKAEDTEELDFDNLMNEFTSLVSSIPKDRMEYFAPRITEITNKYLGKGKKVSNATREQVEQIALIVFDLKDLLNKEG